MPSNAKFFAKVFNKTGATPRRTLDASLFLSAPRIVREVGKPAGTVTVALALPWDDFGYGESDGLNPFDLVKIYAVNADNPTGYLVYQGHVEEIEGVFSSGDSHVNLTLYPIDALFGRSLWKDADYTIGYSGADVDTIFSDAITDVNTIYGASFFTGNLANPGLSINQTYTRLTHLAALQQAAELLGSTYYWRIRPNGQLDLQVFNDSTATHLLVVGKHVDSLSVTKSLLNVKNKIVVSWNSPVEDDEYADASSESNYGRRMALITGTGIGDQTTADARGNGEKGRLKDLFTQTTLTVNSEYAIETILPGDTVEVVNISNNSSQMLSGVLRVLRTEYDGNLCTLSVSDITENFGREFAKAIT